MRVVISRRHLLLNENLAREANRIAEKFDNGRYAKTENIDNLLLNRDISVERKKSILLENLHKSVLSAFSINKKRFNKKEFEALKKKLHNLRRIIIKLRGINYYMETVFLADSGILNIKSADKRPKLKRQSALAKDEISALEYTAYRLIGEVVMLDKKIAGEYSLKEKKVLAEESLQSRSMELVLKKESEVLEHMEAKLPPPRAATLDMVKEPLFTHWVSRIFALLSYLEHIYCQEKTLFQKLKKNKSLQGKIKKKIIHILHEKSKLIRIMEEKAFLMKQPGFDRKLKTELHNLTTAANL